LYCCCLLRILFYFQTAGDKIVSLGIGSDTEVGVVDSGTSFSSPHVAGVLAELSMLYPNASLVEVQQLLFNSTLNKVIGGVPKGTANKLLHHGCAPSDTASGQATLPTSKDTTESFASFASRAGSAGGWKVGARSKPDTLLTMHIFVRHTKHSKDVLKDHLDQVSYPNSPNYGNHMSYQELNKLMKPPSTRIQTIYKWLKTHGVFAASIRTNPAHDILEFDMTVRQAEVLLSTEYYQLKNGLSTIHRSPSLQLPTQVVHHIDIVGPTTHVPHATSFQPLKPLQSNAAFTTPPSLRLQYGIESTTSKTTNSSLGIVGFLDQHFDPKDIAYFWKHFDNKISGKHGKITVNGPNSSPTGEEATLDVSYGSAMSNGLPITFWSTAGQQPGNPANEPFLQWLNDVAKNAAPPYVFSISYSDNENGVEVAFAQRVEVELQKAGARGITIIDSSGDGGVGGSQPDNSCKTFQPTFPASSPYVTAVGGTSGTGLKETASTVFPSGGGFSTLFPRPTYQMKMVDTYFSLAKNLPSKTLFNATGAAYPDVAMSAENFALTQFMVDVPVSGTSCSAPSFAAVVALLNDARMSKGKSSLGWINPLLYANADAFNDIVTGSNAGCAVDSSKGYLGTGFQCSPGFDPVTGLGSPIFAKLKALAIEL
jgi:tripeptidyl-peptidase-1